MLEITVVVKLCPFSADTDDDDAKISRIQAFHTRKNAAKTQIIFITKDNLTLKVSFPHCVRVHKIQSSFELLTNQKAVFSHSLIVALIKSPW